MAATNRYTGLGFSILAGATVISNDATDLSVDFKMRTDERTAGNDADASFNATIREGKWTLKLMDTAEFGTAITIALRIGTTFNLYVYPKGNTTGKPVIAFPALVTDFKQAIQPDKNVTIEIQGMKNGAMISDVGSLA